jgi:CheY-like chemotaxis protein
MNPKITGDTSHTILVCHSNRNLVRMAQLQATRYGIRILVARNSAEVFAIATGQVRPDAVVLSNDLKNPTTDELVKKLNADPRMKGVQVVVLKGMLDGIAQLFKGFKRPPWNMGLPKA